MAKSFLSYEQQILKLKVEKELIVENEAFAKEKLKEVGYYHLITGYNDLFRNKVMKKYKRGVVEKIQMSHGDKPATKKQKEFIEKLMLDYPDSKSMFEYEDYMDVSNRENASELISTIMDQNITDVATKENFVNYIANRPRVERLGEHGLFGDAGKQFQLEEVVKAVWEHKGNVWTHIISLKRDDASRLDFDNAHSWRIFVVQKEMNWQRQ